jgi:ABC-type multidrug transport system permease subunit
MKQFYINNYKAIHHLQMFISIILVFLFGGINPFENIQLLIFLILVNIPATMLLIKLANIEKIVKNIQNEKREN